MRDFLKCFIPKENNSSQSLIQRGKKKKRKNPHPTLFSAYVTGRTETNNDSCSRSHSYATYQIGSFIVLSFLPQENQQCTINCIEGQINNNHKLFSFVAKPFVFSYDNLVSPNHSFSFKNRKNRKLLQKVFFGLCTRFLFN